ncbi:MAG: hypothetical protein ABFC34_08540 [Methanobacterium sp.]
MKTQINLLIRPETLNAVTKAKDKTNKSLSTFVEDAIIYYLSDLGIPVTSEGGL